MKLCSTHFTCLSKTTGLPKFLAKFCLSVILMLIIAECHVVCHGVLITEMQDDLDTCTMFSATVPHRENISISVANVLRCTLTKVFILSTTTDILYNGMA